MTESVAVITGAGGGLGQALARQLAGKHRLVLTDIDEVGLQSTVKLVRDAGGTADAHVSSAADEDAWKSLHDHVESTYGRCDVLVNNAGVALAGQVGEPPLDDVHWLFDINLWGPIYGCHYFVPLMTAPGASGPRHIVNIASAAAFASLPGGAIYNAAKAGVVSLSDTLRAELDGTGVNVLVVCPGFFKSGINEAMRTSDPRALDFLNRYAGMSRWTSEAVAEAIDKAMRQRKAYLMLTPEGRLMGVLRRVAPSFTSRLNALVLSRILNAES